jgi:prevent-host-death family protein
MGATVEVGIRDLRNNLSKYLAGVAQGDELVVTDHGQAVARILPVEVPRPIDRLVAEGLVHRSSVGPRSRPVRRIKTKQPISGLVAEQRR